MNFEEASKLLKEYKQYEDQTFYDTRLNKSSSIRKVIACPSYQSGRWKEFIETFLSNNEDERLIEFYKKEDMDLCFLLKPLSQSVDFYVKLDYFLEHYKLE